jgi:hypothetical protein
VMGLTQRRWSSGGDPSCVFDSANGGHWIITEIADLAANRRYRHNVEPALGGEGRAGQPRGWGLAR